MELLTLALVGLLALIAPLISKVTEVPCVVLEIALGIVFGQSVLGLVRVEGPWTTFLFDFGLIYLLFMAGLEVEARFLRQNAVDSMVIGVLSTLVPLAMGYSFGWAVGFSPELTGVIFSTTSVGVVLPAAKELEHLFQGLAGRSGEVPFHKLLIGATAVSDMLSMFMLAFMIERRGANIQTLALIAAAGVLLLPFYRALQAYGRLANRMIELERRYHFTTRMSMVLMIVLAAAAELIGVHAVVGSFFAGVLVSVLTEGYERLGESLISFGYSLFLPAFFLLAGAKVNLPEVAAAGELWLLPAFLALSYVGKLVGVYVPARLRGHSKEVSLTMGTLMWAKLSLVIAASEAALRLGLVDVSVYSTAVLFALFTVLLAPLAAKILASKTAVDVAKAQRLGEVI